MACEEPGGRGNTAAFPLSPVAPLSRGGEQPAALQQKFTEWLCVSAVPQGKGQ